MSLWVIVPVKPLKRAKSRLAEVLAPETRYRFAETMLRHVLTVTVQVPQVTGTLVISRDTKALSIARELGAKTIQESSSSDLNPALNRATEVIRAWGGNATLILPADLPFLKVTDLSAIAEMGLMNMSVVLAPDHQYDGTNAMLTRPTGLIGYQYGDGSFDLHRLAAEQIGATVKIYESETLNLDIDVPSDLEKYNALVERDGFITLPPFLPDLATE